MIYFRKIRWKNLLSTGNVFTEFDLCSNPTTLIVGANGAGKSTILDALSFGLFGKPFRKINKPQLLNTITQKNLVVEVEFSIGSIDYKVVRGIKPTVFEVYQNGSLLNQSAEMAEYQDILEKQILKVNQKSFSQIVVLGTATFQPFMQLASAQRREVIEDILGLQIFTTMNVLLKDKLSANKELIAEVLTGKKVIESKIEMTKQHMAEIQTSNEKLVEERQESIRKAKDQIKKLEKEVKTIEANIVLMKFDPNEINTIKNKMDKLSKLRHQIEAKQKILKDDTEFFKENDCCPTCRQDINEDFKKKTIDGNTEQLSKIQDGLEQLVDQYLAYNEELKTVMECSSKVNTLELEKVRLESTITAGKKMIKNYEAEIETIQTSHKEASITNLEAFERESSNIESQYNYLMDEKNVLTVTGTLLKDDGIKSKIIKQYIPVINKLINKYLAEFELFVEFELDENFNETIKSRYRDTFSYASFSEGEKQKIDLALLFTWRAIAKLRNSISTNLLVFDEILDNSLDNNAVNYLMTVINEAAKENNIIVISHTEQMPEKFNHVVKFKKVKNFSSIEGT